MLFEALPQHKKDVDDMAAAVLPVAADEARFNEMVQHHVASHLLERIVSAVSDERFTIYYSVYFRCAPLLSVSETRHRNLTHQQ